MANFATIVIHDNFGPACNMSNGGFIQLPDNVAFRWNPKGPCWELWNLTNHPPEIEYLYYRQTERNVRSILLRLMGKVVTQ